MKKWTKKKIIISVFVAMLVVYVVDVFYVPYKEVEIEYLGSVTVDEQTVFEDALKWKELKYVYNGHTGYYTCLGKQILEDYENYNFHFVPDIDENQRYVISYAYPISKLEYTKKYTTSRDNGYYNRARLDVEKYESGTLFFYKMENINLGTMVYEQVEFIG